MTDAPTPPPPLSPHPAADEYTCCTEGHTDGEECGDYYADWGVIWLLFLLFGLVWFVLTVLSCSFSIVAFCDAPKLGTTSAPCCTACPASCLCVMNGALAFMNLLFFIASCILLAHPWAFFFVLELIGYIITLVMTVIAVVMLKQKQMWWDLKNVEQRSTIAHQSHSGGIELPAMGQPVPTVQTIASMPPPGGVHQGAIVSTAVPIKGGAF